MVVPNRHLSALEALTPDEQAELMRLARLSEMALTEAYRPHGINVGINLGKAAGAGIENHLHIHLVPRWSGDTNFMTAVGETRVLPEELSGDGRAAAADFREARRRDLTLLVSERDVRAERTLDDLKHPSIAFAIVCSCRFDVPS